MNKQLRKGTQGVLALALLAGALLAPAAAEAGRKPPRIHTAAVEQAAPLSADFGRRTPDPVAGADNGRYSPRIEAGDDAGRYSPRPETAADNGRYTPRPDAGANAGRFTPRLLVARRAKAVR
jgi:hypothetical protein